MKSLKFQKRIAVWAAVLMIMGTVTGCAAKTGDQNQAAAGAGQTEAAAAGQTEAAADTAASDSAKEEVAAVILHTNDVHAGYEDNIGYDGLAL